MRKTIAFVLAGGVGSRLLPLTAHEAKPALDFVGGTRIIDFVLSNLVNSGIGCIYVLAQYKPQSLVDHVRSQWEPELRSRGGSVQVILPDPDRRFRGTADAVHQTLHLCTGHAPDLVVLCEADTPAQHVYFPTEGFISLVTKVDTHPGLEMGTVGREGTVGVHLALGVTSTPLLALVQGAGASWCVGAVAFATILEDCPVLKQELYRYVYVLMAQVVTSRYRPAAPAATSLVPSPTQRP